MSQSECVGRLAAMFVPVWWRCAAAFFFLLPTSKKHSDVREFHLLKEMTSSVFSSPLQLAAARLCGVEKLMLAQRASKRGRGNQTCAEYGRLAGRRSGRRLGSVTRNCTMLRCSHLSGSASRCLQGLTVCFLSIKLRCSFTVFVERVCWCWRTRTTAQRSPGSPAGSTGSTSLLNILHLPFYRFRSRRSFTFFGFRTNIIKHSAPFQVDSFQAVTTYLTYYYISNYFILYYVAILITDHLIKTSFVSSLEHADSAETFTDTSSLIWLFYWCLLIDMKTLHHDITTGQ